VFGWWLRPPRPPSAERAVLIETCTLMSFTITARPDSRLPPDACAGPYAVTRRGRGLPSELYPGPALGLDTVGRPAVPEAGAELHHSGLGRPMAPVF